MPQARRDAQAGSSSHRPAPSPSTGAERAGIRRLAALAGNRAALGVVQRATFRVSKFEQPAPVGFSAEAGNGPGGRILSVGLGANVPHFEAEAEVEGVGEDQDLADWSVGFIQTVLSDERRAVYPTPNGDAILHQWLPGPTKDGRGDPWYKQDEAKAFTDRDRESLTVRSGGDTPKFHVPLSMRAHAATGDHEAVVSSTEGESRFGLWLAAKRGDDVRPLVEVQWRTGYASTIDPVNATATGGAGSGASAGPPGPAPANPPWLLTGAPANESSRQEVIGADANAYDSSLPATPNLRARPGDHVAVHPGAANRANISYGENFVTSIDFARKDQWVLRVLGETAIKGAAAYQLTIVESRTTDDRGHDVSLLASELTPTNVPAPAGVRIGDPPLAPAIDLGIGDVVTVSPGQTFSVDLFEAGQTESVDTVTGAHAVRNGWRAEVIGVLDDENVRIRISASSTEYEVGNEATIGKRYLVLNQEG